MAARSQLAIVDFPAAFTRVADSACTPRGLEVCPFLLRHLFALQELTVVPLHFERTQSFLMVRLDAQDVQPMELRFVGQFLVLAPTCQQQILRGGFSQRLAHTC